MELIKPIIARLIQVSLLSVLFLTSCVGPVFMYKESSRWFPKEANIDEDHAFYIAYISKGVENSGNLMVSPYRDDVSKSETSYHQFRLPEESMSFSWGVGEGNARIWTANEPGGSQLVQVFVIGDTPWTSFSEYRVVDNKIHPLRHGFSQSWLLLGMVIFPFLFHAVIRKYKGGTRGPSKFFQFLYR